MPEKLDPRGLVSLSELLMSEVIRSEAQINLLERKSGISNRELLEEMKKARLYFLDLNPLR